MYGAYSNHTFQTPIQLIDILKDVFEGLGGALVTFSWKEWSK